VVTPPNQPVHNDGFMKVGSRKKNISGWLVIDFKCKGWHLKLNNIQQETDLKNSVFKYHTQVVSCVKYNVL
jgi:hypothetical protein